MESLAAFFEAGCEALGEAGHEDAALRGGHVVGNAVVDDAGGFDVVDGVCGAPVMVAGLADGAGIDEMAGAGREIEDPVFFVGTRGVARADLVPIVLFLREAALHVGVAEEGDGGGHLLEGHPGVAHAEDVGVLVER